ISAGGRPLAVRVPMTDPADVPTITSASAAFKPVRDSSASSAPMSHEAPTTPPAPSTSPTRVWKLRSFGVNPQNRRLLPLQGKRGSLRAEPYPWDERPNALGAHPLSAGGGIRTPTACATGT